MASKGLGFKRSSKNATLDNAPNIPTLRKILGQSRKLRKENKKHKNSVKKCLHRQIANTRQIDNVHNMGNFPLSNSEKTVLNKGLSFVYSPDLVTKDEVFKAFLKFNRRMLLHYHFFIRPSNNKTDTQPNKFKLASNCQNTNILSVTKNTQRWLPW